MGILQVYVSGHKRILVTPTPIIRAQYYKVHMLIIGLEVWGCGNNQNPLVRAALALISRSPTPGLEFRFVLGFGSPGQGTVICESYSLDTALTQQQPDRN